MTRLKPPGPSWPSVDSLNMANLLFKKESLHRLSLLFPPTFSPNTRLKKIKKQIIFSSVPQYIYHWFLKTLLYPSWNESLLVYLRQYTILFQRETLLYKYLLCNVTDTQLIKNKIQSNFWAWYWEFNILTNIDRLIIEMVASAVGRCHTLCRMF